MFCFFFFETQTPYITKAGLEFLILLPPPPECWNFRLEPRKPGNRLSVLINLVVLERVILADLDAVTAVLFSGGLENFGMDCTVLFLILALFVCKCAHGSQKIESDPLELEL